jgi:hypothetical protein
MVLIMLLVLGIIRYCFLVLLLQQKQYAIVGVHIKNASNEINNANISISDIFINFLLFSIN